MARKKGIIVIRFRYNGLFAYNELPKKFKAFLSKQYGLCEVLFTMPDVEDPEPGYNKNCVFIIWFKESALANTVKQLLKTKFGMRLRIDWLDDQDLDIFNLDKTDIEDLKRHPVTEGIKVEAKPASQYTSFKGKKKKNKAARSFEEYDYKEEYDEEWEEYEEEPASYDRNWPQNTDDSQPSTSQYNGLWPHQTSTQQQASQEGVANTPTPKPEPSRASQKSTPTPKSSVSGDMTPPPDVMETNSGKDSIAEWYKFAQSNPQAYQQYLQFVQSQFMPDTNQLLASQVTPGATKKEPESKTPSPTSIQQQQLQPPTPATVNPFVMAQTPLLYPQPIVQVPMFHPTMMVPSTLYPPYLYPQPAMAEKSNTSKPSSSSKAPSDEPQSAAADRVKSEPREDQLTPRTSTPDNLNKTDPVVINVDSDTELEKDPAKDIVDSVDLQAPKSPTPSQNVLPSDEGLVGRAQGAPEDTPDEAMDEIQKETEALKLKLVDAKQMYGPVFDKIQKTMFEEYKDRVNLLVMSCEMLSKTAPVMKDSLIPVLQASLTELTKKTELNFWKEIESLAQKPTI